MVLKNETKKDRILSQVLVLCPSYHTTFSPHHWWVAHSILFWISVHETNVPGYVFFQFSDGGDWVVFWTTWMVCRAQMKTGKPVKMQKKYMDPGEPTLWLLGSPGFLYPGMGNVCYVNKVNCHLKAYRLRETVVLTRTKGLMKISSSPPNRFETESLVHHVRVCLIYCHLS